MRHTIKNVRELAARSGFTLEKLYGRNQWRIIEDATGRRLLNKDGGELHFGPREIFETLTERS